MAEPEPGVRVRLLYLVATKLIRHPDRHVFRNSVDCATPLCVKRHGRIVWTKVVQVIASVLPFPQIHFPLPTPKVRSRAPRCRQEFPHARCPIVDRGWDIDGFDTRLPPAGKWLWRFLLRRGIRPGQGRSSPSRSTEAVRCIL